MRKIPIPHEGQIYAAVFTTKKGTEGTGFGLSISNDILKAHGGEPKIKSAESDHFFDYITLWFLNALESKLFLVTAPA